jgi:hypothetical protein
MSEDLIKRIRAAREQWLQLDDRMAIQWRQPGWEEQARMMRGGMEQMRATVALVIDWRGVTQADLLPDAAPEAAPFSAEAWELLLAEHLEWLPTLMARVADTLEARRAAQEQARGN